MLNPGMMLSTQYEWETPRSFFDDLNKKYSFTLDPCCTEENRKCEKFFTKKENGLYQSWVGETVFVNPPYGREIGKWMAKCYQEISRPEDPAKLVVALIPARTDTRYFHSYIYHKASMVFIKGRLKFELNGKPMGPAPFPSMLAIWEPGLCVIN